MARRKVPPNNPLDFLEARADRVEETPRSIDPVVAAPSNRKEGKKGRGIRDEEEGDAFPPFAPIVLDLTSTEVPVTVAALDVVITAVADGSLPHKIGDTIGKLLGLRHKMTAPVAAVVPTGPHVVVFNVPGMVAPAGQIVEAPHFEAIEDHSDRDRDRDRDRERVPRHLTFDVATHR